LSNPVLVRLPDSLLDIPVRISLMKYKTSQYVPIMYLLIMLNLIQAVVILLAAGRLWIT
jgi:hypothetical protein